jgi:pyruvate ferredoxin oxidoreductase alpha subunit
MAKVEALTGGEAVAEAMRQINPDVAAIYPITPQTIIMQKFADFHADGKVSTELIRAESEHSAMSCCIGSAAAGARTMTATSSAGLALMWEMLGVASGLRLPIIMPVVNRALSAPINIHGDHSDAMGSKDHGWVQIFCEDAQEAYEATILAVRIAEHAEVQLPVMICQDGFITSHGMQNVETLDDADVKNFVGEYLPKKWLLNTDDPVTVGPLQLQDYNFETQRQRNDSMLGAKEIYLKIGKELSKITGREYPLFEEYKTEGADTVMVVMSSTAGNARVVVDRLRAKGKKVGLLKPRLFRPFPYKEIGKALANKKNVIVLDRAFSYGASAPLYAEIKNSLYDAKRRPKIKSYVFGIGGRNILESEIEEVFKTFKKSKLDEQGYISLRGG